MSHVPHSHVPRLGAKDHELVFFLDFPSSAIFKVLLWCSALGNEIHHGSGKNRVNNLNCKGV